MNSPEVTPEASRQYQNYTPPSKRQSIKTHDKQAMKAAELICNMIDKKDWRLFKVQFERLLYHVRASHAQNVLNHLSKNLK